MYCIGSYSIEWKRIILWFLFHKIIYNWSYWSLTGWWSIYDWNGKKIKWPSNQYFSFNWKSFIWSFSIEIKNGHVTSIEKTDHLNLFGDKKHFKTIIEAIKFRPLKPTGKLHFFQFKNRLFSKKTELRILYSFNFNSTILTTI